VAEKHPKSEFPLLEVEHFSFGFEEQALLKDLSFTLQKEAFTLVGGASGSGKSTLALCLNGLYPEAVEGWKQGSIRLHGQEVEEFKKGSLSQKIGVVFQDPESQFCMMKVEDELAFVLENQQVPSYAMEKKIDSVLDEIGMKAYKHDVIHELSGGQKQKIALASILLMQPELLILDEPTANLDPVSSVEFIELVKSVQRERQCRVLLIEHQPDDWFPLIERVLLLGRNGSILADGSPYDIYRSKQMLYEEGIHIPLLMQPPETLVEKQIPDCREEIIKVEGLAFSRGEKTILADVDFQLNKGEFVAVTGENGAGKSTLLQLLARLIQPQKGHIVFGGKPLDEWGEGVLRQKSGYVFQNPEHQFITDSVDEELSFGMLMNKKTDVKLRVEQLLKNFHLKEHQFANPFSLSGGQKRRLSVASMLDDTPDILFFDEPTFGQDAKTTDELMKMVTALQRKGTTIVFVTHDMELVDRYCGRVLVLSEGSLAYNGEPEKLWENKELLQEARLRLPFRKREGKAYGLVD
jgi:energy-coupling factor transport system ATP-binding protein